MLRPPENIYMWRSTAFALTNQRMILQLEGHIAVVSQVGCHTDTGYNLFGSEVHKHRLSAAVLKTTYSRLLINSNVLITLRVFHSYSNVRRPNSHFYLQFYPRRGLIPFSPSSLIGVLPCVSVRFLCLLAIVQFWIFGLFHFIERVLRVPLVSQCKMGL